MTDPARPARRDTRDRHGRGARGSLAPREVPISRTRSQAFDELVLDAVSGIDRRWSARLQGVEFEIDDVPPTGELGRDTAEPIPLATLVPATGRTAARVLVYRRPIEARSADAEDLADLVRDVVIEQVAALLGIPPADIDPGWDDDDS